MPCELITDPGEVSGITKYFLIGEYLALLESDLKLIDLVQLRDNLKMIGKEPFVDVAAQDLCEIWLL